MGKWEMVRLGDVCEILDSQRIPVTASERKAGNYPYFGANGIQGHVSDYIFDDELVLLAEDGGNFGSKTRPIAYRVSGKCWVNNHAHVLRAKQCLDTDYLCKSIMFYDVSKLISGTTRAKLNQAAMRKMLIPLPPIDEQKRIAKNLDLAGEIVKGYKEQLAELDKLAQSVFYEMFGDPVTNEKGWIRQSLLDFGSCKNGMNFGANESGIEIKYLGVGDFKELSIIEGVDSLSTISLVQTPSNEYLLRDEDIIFVRSNGNKNLVGRCVVVYPGDAALTFSGFCIRFRKSSDKLMTIYLLYVLKCASVRRLLLGRGANIQNLNQQILKQLTVPVPPISLQSQFIEMIAEIENQKSQVQRASIEAGNLFNGLMQEYFE